MAGPMLSPSRPVISIRYVIRLRAAEISSTRWMVRTIASPTRASSTNLSGRSAESMTSSTGSPSCGVMVMALPAAKGPDSSARARSAFQTGQLGTSAQARHTVSAVATVSIVYSAVHIVRDSADATRAVSEIRFSANRSARHVSSPRGALVQPKSGQCRREPPRCTSDQPERGRKQQAPYEHRVGEHRERGADAEDLQDHDVRDPEDADRDGEENGGRHDDPADGRDAACDRFTVAATREPCLAHTAEEKDAVIRRDREHECREDEWDGQVESGLARVAEDPFEA